MKEPSISHILKKYPAGKEYLIKILHEIQNENPHNYLPESALIEVAKHLNISMSAVMGVVEYYTMFSAKKRGKYIVRICKSPVCINKESDRIAEAIERKYGIKPGETSLDGLLTLEFSECLGRCSEGSAVSINKHYFLRPRDYNIVQKIEDFIKGNHDA